MIAELIRTISTPIIHREVVRHLDYVTGLENIPRSGPLVVVANHSSYADHFMTLTVLNAVRPGQVWYPTKAEAFESFGSRVWHESMNCFSVRRDAPSDAIFVKAKRVLEGGNILVLYPEGTRGPGGELLPFKSGAFRMALASGAPVIPIGMWNLQRVLPKGSSQVSQELASVAVGAPLPVQQDGGSGMTDREVVNTMRADARRAIEALIVQAHTATGADHAVAAGEIAKLMSDITMENLEGDGRLPGPVIQRLTLLHSIGRRVARRVEAPLSVQQARTHGFKALAAQHPVKRLVTAAVVNRRATRLARENATDRFASYLAAQSNLVTPRWAGGDLETAKSLFENAAYEPGLVSRACVGLGEALARDGQIDQAHTVWKRALTSIDPKDPRGAGRRNKVEKLRSQYPAVS